MPLPQLMGILNLTPDSFSGDGIVDVDAAVAAAHRLVAEGAKLIDIGAESTRPGATAVAPAAEWARLEPVLRRLADAPWRPQVRLSVDTRHATTARACLDCGIDMLNDVSGLTDPRMREVAAAATCDVVVMHATAVPADPAVKLPADCDVVAALAAWRDETIRIATQAGIAAQRLIFDPGIGFGKSTRQTLDLIARVDALTGLGGRWLFGHSRKSILPPACYTSLAQRDDATLLVSALLARSQVSILRVHQLARHAALFAQLRR